MRNPWIHNDVPDTVGSEGRMGLLMWAIWGLLLLTFVGFLFAASRGLIDTGNGTLAETVIQALSVLLLFLLAVPILRKLLAISRLLTMLALFATGWVFLRVLDLQDVVWAHSMLNEAPPDPVVELFDLLAALG